MRSTTTVTDDQELPNSEERTFIKYHYYIHQGIDIVNIAPLESSWIANILNRVPPKLRSKSRSIDALLSEVQVSFLETFEISRSPYTVGIFICITGRFFIECKTWKNS